MRTLTVQAFVDRVVARLLGTPVDLARLDPQGISGSLYAGGAGVAFFLYEASRLTGAKELLGPARAWCEAAREWARGATIAEWRGHGSGFVMGETGIAYVEALLCGESGNAEGVLAAVTRIEQSSARPHDLPPGVRVTELMSGAAGNVCAARDLEARLPRDGTHVAARRVLARVRERNTAVLAAAHAGPYVPLPDDRLGLAHGYAGELWALVATLSAGHALVRARLAELAALREVDEDGLLYWLPVHASDETSGLVTWCNGMAGHTLLWCEVARQTGDAEAQNLAHQAAESTVVLTAPGPTLCCGLAGHAVALRRYARLASDARFEELADDRLASAIAMAEGQEDPSFLALWQGTLGVALVAMSNRGGDLALPGIDSEPTIQPSGRSGAH